MPQLLERVCLSLGQLVRRPSVAEPFRLLDPYPRLGYGRMTVSTVVGLFAILPSVARLAVSLPAENRGCPNRGHASPNPPADLAPGLPPRFLGVDPTVLRPAMLLYTAPWPSAGCCPHCRPPGPAMRQMPVPRVDVRLDRPWQYGVLARSVNGDSIRHQLVGRTPLRTDASCGFRAIAPMVVYFTSPDLRALLPVDDPPLPQNAPGLPTPLTTTCCCCRKRQSYIRTKLAQPLLQHPTPPSPFPLPRASF